MLNFDGVWRVYTHIRLTNMQKRIDQITDLFNQICTEYPIRIDPNKINQSIKSINLAWILAICRMGYNSFGDIDFSDKALNAMAESLRGTLSAILRTNGTLTNLNAKYYDEVDLATGMFVTKTASYNLSPELIASVLYTNPYFSKYLFTNTTSNKKINNEFSSNDTNILNLDISQTNITNVTSITILKESIISSQHNEDTNYKSNIQDVAPAKNCRIDAISEAIVNHVLPELLPEKVHPTNKKDINQLSFRSFELLEQALIKIGATSIKQEMSRKKEDSYIQAIDKSHEPIRTTYGAFRKRFRTFLNTYLR